MKTPLQSTLGQLFAFICYYFVLFTFGLIIYGVIVNDLAAIIAGIIFGLFNYIIFARKLFRSTTITFDKDYFYFKDNSKIELSQIQFIHDGKITYLDNKVEKSIYVNHFFPSKNYELFYNYFRLKK